MAIHYEAIDSSTWHDACSSGSGMFHRVSCRAESGRHTRTKEDMHVATDPTLSLTHWWDSTESLGVSDTKTRLSLPTSPSPPSSTPHPSTGVCPRQGTAITYLPTSQTIQLSIAPHIHYWTTVPVYCIMGGGTRDNTARLRNTDTIPRLHRISVLPDKSVC